MRIMYRFVFLALCIVAIPASAQERSTCILFDCADGTTETNCEYLGEACTEHGGVVQPFSDVTFGHPNRQAITYVKSQGIVQGYSNGTFKPDMSINRAEFTKILVAAKYAGADCAISPNTFTDVRQGQWFAVFVCIASNDGWIEGYADGSFKPANTINFVEAAKVLVNRYELPFEQTDVWYEGYVRGLERKNAIPPTITRFDQKVTRGEMAEMIYRLETGIPYAVNRTYEDIERGSKTFDGCGKVSSYSKHSWFADFAAQAEKNGFDMEYSEGFTEGCLALDGSLFMAIYSGGYCEGSTFLLYKPFEKNLDTAGIQWKTEDTCAHNINEFGAREGSLIKLTGAWGDAGCWAEFFYDYDLVSNVIVKTATKSLCVDDPKPVWRYY